MSTTLKDAVFTWLMLGFVWLWTEGAMHHVYKAGASRKVDIS